MGVSSRVLTSLQLMEQSLSDGLNPHFSLSYIKTHDHLSTHYDAYKYLCTLPYIPTLGLLVNDSRWLKYFSQRTSHIYLYFYHKPIRHFALRQIFHKPSPTPLFHSFCSQISHNPTNLLDQQKDLHLEVHWDFYLPHYPTRLVSLDTSSH